MAREMGTQMILAEWLFVETVADVRHRSQNPGDRSRYGLLGIAPMLRKLLLDGASLVDTVRAGRPEALLEFRVLPPGHPGDRALHCQGDQNVASIAREVINLAMRDGVSGSANVVL
jgi:hypothetical protein